MVEEMPLKGIELALPDSLLARKLSGKNDLTFELF